jgi:release factor glutamine methyltransferase
LAALSSFVLQSTERLRMGPHPDRARQDAEILLLNVLGKDKAWLMAHLEDEPSAEHAMQYTEWIEHRYVGEPIQYIAGETEFYGLPFRVTHDVLIPRPETEHLVEKTLALAARFHAPRIVDIGTGSGAIAISLAYHFPNAAIAAIDLSAAALTVARRNAEVNGIADRIRFLEGDLLAPVAREQFDIVVSNPPYVPTTDRSTLAVEVRDYEPALALFAGADGLDIYRRLIPAAFAVLIPDGFVALEIGHGQSPAIASLLAESGFDQI